MVGENRMKLGEVNGLMIGGGGTGSGSSPRSHDECLCEQYKTTKALICRIDG